MIDVRNIEVFNFEGAIRGMRNPMNSWNKSDSYMCMNQCKVGEHAHCIRDWSKDEPFFCVGDNDLKLMHKLFEGGTEHRKFMRQIMISLDITAPLYWWKEFDTYKVGTTANSCSTMHKLHSRDLTYDDFSVEHLSIFNRRILGMVINAINGARMEFIETKDKKFWWQMIQLLPSCYNQTRTVTMNYENAVSMIRQRENHKLDEWRDFVKVLTELPYLEEIVNGI